MSVIPRKLPHTYALWQGEVNKNGLASKTIHTTELASASKMGYTQFLLLRVLWQIHKTKDRGAPILPERLTQFLSKANEMLANFQSWKSYLGSFQGRIPEGSFAVVRYYQLIAAKTEQNTRPDSFDTPIAKRTRHQLQGISSQISKLQLNPATPSKKPVKEFPTPIVDEVLDEEWAIGMEETPLVPITPAALVPHELQKEMFPPTKDEQIVNIALLVFLNALTMHFDISQRWKWTPHRKGFVPQFRDGSFHAHTDGYLHDEQETPYALIEVKPVVRAGKQNLIQMQESAQMVGWIMSEPDAPRDKLRIHLAQDRHEIFVIFAEYNDDYLAYLNGNFTGTSNKMSFLTMHQLGPWNIEDPSDMRTLGPILLAMALNADAESRGAR